MNQENVIKKAYQDYNPSRPSKNINQCNCNTDNKIKKVHLVNDEDYKELIRFLDGVQALVINDRQELAIEALEHKKKVLQEKIEEEIGRASCRERV